MPIFPIWTNGVYRYELQPQIFFPIFSFIQNHCKKTFNDSFHAEFHALQACVIGLERIELKNVENSEIKRSSVSIWIPTPVIFRLSSVVKIRCKETFNNSFYAEFHALQACVIGLGGIDFRNVENAHMSWSGSSLWIRTPNIFRFFPHIEIHCKERLNSSLVAEFHALEGFVIGAERIGFKSPENSRLFFLVLMFRLIDSESESVLRSTWLCLTNGIVFSEFLKSILSMRGMYHRRALNCASDHVFDVFLQ